MLRPREFNEKQQQKNKKLRNNDRVDIASQKGSERKDRHVRGEREEKERKHQLEQFE